MRCHAEFNYNSTAALYWIHSGHSGSSSSIAICSKRRSSTYSEVAQVRSCLESRSHRRFAMSYTGYQFTVGSSTNYAFLCSNANTSRLQHTCRRSVCHSQLSQPVVSCGRLPETTSISREHELSHGSRAFAVSGPTCWNSLPSSVKSPLLKPAHFCKQQLKTILMAQPS